MSSKEEQIKMHEGIIENQRKTIAVLKEEIEAEKPKLRHGDFGYGSGDSPFVVVEQETLFGSPKAFFANMSGQAGADKAMPDAIKIGNIFNLLNEWSEPFKEFTVIGQYNFIGYIPFGEPDKIRLKIVNGESSYILPELEEIWHGLGRGIAYLKRKLAK